MEYNHVKNKNKETRLVIGQIIIALFMIFDVYLLLTKVELAPKLLAGGALVLLLGLFIISFKKTIHLKK